MWRAKYYPVPARQLHESGVSDLELIDACLLKWSGLTEEVMNHYGLKTQGRELTHKEVCEPLADYEPLFIDAESCALCIRYMKGDAESGEHVCFGCPIKELRGASCDRRLPQELNSPYGAWYTTKNPQLMINTLEDSRRFVSLHGRLTPLLIWLRSAVKKVKRAFLDALDAL